jgi:hypothetical protein
VIDGKDDIRDIKPDLSIAKGSLDTAFPANLFCQPVRTTKKTGEVKD